MKKRATPPLTAPPSVLLVGPETSERSALQAILQTAECRTFVCARCRDAIDLMQFASVVICEQSLPDGSWRDLLRTVQVQTGPPALIVTSRLADSELWAEVLNLGGYGVLAQPFRAQEVMWSVRNAHGRYAGRRGTSPGRSATREPTPLPAAHISMGENSQRCAFSGRGSAPPSAVVCSRKS